MISAFKPKDDHLVYVKQVLVADLPSDVQEKAGDLTTLFAVHKSSGEQMALVADRAMAFALARHHDMEPVAVH